jgi:hypothetical protein
MPMYKFKYHEIFSCLSTTSHDDYDGNDDDDNILFTGEFKIYLYPSLK